MPLIVCVRMYVCMYVCVNHLLASTTSKYSTTKYSTTKLPGTTTSVDLVYVVVVFYQLCCSLIILILTLPIYRLNWCREVVFRYVLH